jgi:hypothetical protein
MDHTTFTVPVRAGTDLEAEAVFSLYHALEVLPDPRRGQGKRYSLALILALVILVQAIASPFRVFVPIARRCRTIGSA